MGPPGYVTAEVDTDAVPRMSRIAFWRDHVTRNHGRLGFGFRDADRFAGGTRVQRQGDLQLVDFWSTAIAYERLPSGHDGDGLDSLRIVLPTSGSISVAGCEGRTRIGPGTAAAVSMKLGFRLEQDGYARALILSCPARLWAAPVSSGLVLWELGHGAGAVFRTMLREASTQASTLDRSSFASILESAVGLLSRGATSTEDDVLLQARAVARQYCDDAGFGPGELALRLGWSLRSVQYGLRRASTTPASVIREARIERAASRLRHPAWAARTVSSIAHASGFGSLSAFNAAFRARYGLTPVEYRGEA
jgi:AraC-like DNA-binding protein